ncbi:MAG: DMT family transporter, partial [Candidatus Micrarchaeota archaeon]
MVASALLWALATAAISGFAIFANKFGVAGINSGVYALARGALVAMLLAAVMLAMGSWRQLKQLSRKQWLLLATVGLVGGCIPFLLFFSGLQLTAAAQASFIHKTMFAFVAAISLVALKEKPGAKTLAAAILLLAGNFLFLQLSTPAWDYGSLLILAATVLWAGENVLSKKLLSEIQPDVLAFGRMAFGAAFTAAWLATTGEISLAANLTGLQWQWIAATSLLLLLYVTTWYRALQGLNATLATSILLLGAPITAVLSYAYAGAAVTPLQAAGAAMLAVGII